MHYAETKYGFEYGAATIERACSDERTGWVMLLIRTPKYKDGLKVYVTKTGKIRVLGTDKEWKPQ